MIEGPQEESFLMTGLHVVADINCSICQALLGWKYVNKILFYTHIFRFRRMKKVKNIK